MTWRLIGMIGVVLLIHGCAAGKDGQVGSPDSTKAEVSPARSKQAPSPGEGGPPAAGSAPPVLAPTSTQAPSLASGAPKPGRIDVDRAYDIGYAAIVAKLGYAPPGRDDWFCWGVQLVGEALAEDYHGLGKRTLRRISVNTRPAGGGDHATAFVDAETGELVHVRTGRSLR